jgi:hypothetical protein
MSKLVVSHYRIPSAEEQRATQRKIALIRQMLQRCMALREALERFESVEGESLAEIMQRYDEAIVERRWEDFTGNYNRLYDSLPELEKQLEKRVAAARGRRLRLELTALTLANDTADVESKAVLETLARQVKAMRTQSLDTAAAQIETLLMQSLGRAPETAGPAVTQTQLELARALMHPDAAVPGQIGGGRSKPQGGPDSDHSRIDRLIGTLSALDDDVAAYVERARRIAAEKDAGRRAIQLDSLIIEVSEHEARRRTARDLGRFIGEALAELDPFDGPSVENLRGRLHGAREVGDARRLLEEARTIAAVEARSRDGALARDAMMRGLRALGYDLRLQGTAWEEGARIEIMRSDEPNYDIQLSAPPNGRIQSKVRAYSHAGRSDGVNRRDVEVEQGWCDDLRKLNAMMQAQGFATDIEHEEGPGTAAQKPLPQGVEDRIGAGTMRGRTQPM